jgi:branched-chain amino acid transport system ATP-binding protein
MLSVNNIEVVYDKVILVLRGVSLEVKVGAITTLLGGNGAGKTTTLKAISGVLRTERGSVTKGTITLEGKRIDGMRPFDITKLGVAQVFEGRRVFEHLTTEENLVAGGHTQSDLRKIRENIERVYAYFPALMSDPRVVLLDEPSLGLAPMLVEEIFGIVQRLVQQEKLSVLLVEQNATMALAVAEHGYVMETGRIVLEGTVEALRSNSDIREFYLGLNEVGSRKSYRDVKHYKRRKRWLS